MSTLESYVPLIQAEAERLAQFLDTLSTDDLHLPTFRTSYTALTELMTALHEQAWDAVAQKSPCACRG